MKILKLHIENFGKLIDFSYEFHNGLNQFVEKNGWGKSTLATFINAMFYGLEANGKRKDYQSERSKFLPWQGGIYGGSLTFKTKQKVYTIYRTFGKTPEQDTFQIYDETLKQISQDFTENIGEELFGVGKETFCISSYFGQSNLSFDLTDEAVSNLAGLEKFKNDAESVDKALNVIEKRRKELVSNSPKKVEMLQLTKSINDLGNAITLKQQKARELKNNLLNLEKEKELLEKKNQEIEQEKKSQLKIINEKNFLQQELNQKSQQLNNILISKRENDKKNPKIKVKLFLSLTFLAISIVFILLGITQIMDNILSYVFAGVFFLIGIILLSFKGKKFKEEIEHSEVENSLRQEIEILNIKLNDYANLNLKVFDTTDNFLREAENEYFATLANYKEVLADLDRMQEELSILSQNKNITEEKILQNEKKIDLLKLTANFLNKARENVSQRFVKPINEKFESFINKFVLQDKINIDSKFVASVITNTGAKNLQYLSKGSQDLVAICQRFSMIEDIFKKEKPFLVLDDSFVNIDDGKIKSVNELINLLSQTYQILYFTCSESRKF